MKTRTFMSMMCFFLLGSYSFAEVQTIELTVQTGKHEYNGGPLCVPLSLPKSFAEVEATFFAYPEKSRRRSVAQLTSPSLLTEAISPARPNSVRRDLHLVLSKLPANTTVKLRIGIDDRSAKVTGNYHWKDVEGEYSELIWKNQSTTIPVLRYMKKTYDDSSTDGRNKSYKVFHHLYDPAGKRFVTNGGYTDPHDNPKSLLYPHHRGLMYGFNNITYGGGKKADTWHCPAKGNKTAHVEHVKTLSREAGPLLGRHRVLINWYGAEKDPFAQEEREMTVYKTGGGTLVEFASRLKTTGGPVKLDGDPQHAGFQFRASNDVAAMTRRQTYYLRIGGKGKPGQTINWSGKNSPQGTVEIPWKAMSFVLDHQRYTAAYLDHPKNPGEARHSERDYGRFGCYFVYELTEDNPLLVNNRIWLQEGEMTISQVQDLYEDFVSPPVVSTK